MSTEIIESNIEIGSELVLTKTIIGQADDLALEHEDFSEQYIIAGRKAMYKLLEKIYALSEQLDKSIDKEEQITLLRRILAEKHGIRTQQNTSDVTVLVRYITKADRKTAHVYSRAIEIARMNRVDSSNFVGYVEQAGGVERIRSSSATNKELHQDLSAIESEIEYKYELARKYLTARTELPLASFNLGKRYTQTSKTNSYKQFIGYERNGRYYVLTQQDLDGNQELKLIEQIAEWLDPNLKYAEKKVIAFYSKAMLKRKQRTMKEITRRRPELAARIRQVA